MARTVTTPIQKRFMDVDSFCHVNNVAQQMYFDLGKTDYYNKVLGGVGLFGSKRILTVATRTSYIDQIRFTDEVHVTTCVSKIGNKSITLCQRIIDSAGRLCTESESVMVAFDFDAQQSIPVPDEWRNAIQNSKFKIEVEMILQRYNIW